MHDLTSTVGVAALAAGGVAVIALVWAVALTVRMRRLLADQRVVLGDGEGADLVAHAAQLDRSFRMLHDYVEEIAARLDGRLAEAERRLDGSIAYRGLVRYDAYNEMSGRQSTTIALLDASGSGIVLSSIHHREQARLYAKRVVERRGELELSPEEEEAIRIALTDAAPSPASPA